MFSRLYEFLLRVFGYNQGIRGKFWYSVKQKKVYLSMGEPLTNYARLDNGQILPYTEMTGDLDAKVASGSWSDYQYVGRGKWSHKT